MIAHHLARVGALVCLLALAGCSGSSIVPHKSATHRVTGVLTLSPDGSIASDIADYGECQGGLGYDDVRTGMQVLLKDGDGETLAVAALGPGKNATNATTTNGVRLVMCQWTFALPDVPDRPFYAFSLGRRGAPTYSRDELAADGWAVKITLGF